jgi:hypothetical protein
MRKEFPVARMSPLILGLTVLLLAMPVLFIGIGIFIPAPTQTVMLITGVLIVLLYLGIWVYARPSSYHVTPAELTILWPVRRKPIPRHDVASARVMDLSSFRSEYGNTIRIGAGGLFGTFGWLWSRKAGRLDVYVTNLGPWVVVERRASRPLILSPEDPEGFADALEDNSS